MRKARPFAITAYALLTFFAFAALDASAQKQKREHIQAVAFGTSTQLGRLVNIDFIINEHSTPEDQKVLLEAFGSGGSEGLANALDKMHSKGRIRITGTVGYDVNYIRVFKMADGGRKIRFITDRPVTLGEAWHSTRSMDYNLTAGEIIISPQKGKNSGTLFPVCQFKIDKEREIEIEAFQNPWKLEHVKASK